MSTGTLFVNFSFYKRVSRTFSSPFLVVKMVAGRFGGWLREPDPQPYNSWGNGSAMRVAPVGWAFDSLDQTLSEAEKSAAVSHNHPEGIKGAQATAAAVWLARNGKSKPEIEKLIRERFGYDLSRSISDIRRTYQFNESCQGTVPQALSAFLQSNNFEESIRNAISLGGDADTLACITGCIAEAFYREIPSEMTVKARKLLHPMLLQIVNEFTDKYVRR
jgi:ADP-ribosyl-[dinitrogen reductase] hydrolase